MVLNELHKWGALAISVAGAVSRETPSSADV